MPDNPVEAAGKAAEKGAKGTTAFLQARTFGMPRWVFLALLAGGVGVGLYLRSRATDEEELTEEETDVTGDVSSLEEAALYDAGLAGTGFVGPVAGSVLPVQQPTIPEGIPDLFSSLTGLLESWGAPPSAAQPAAPAPSSPAPPTGGGAPIRPSHQTMTCGGKPRPGHVAGCSWICKNRRWVKKCGTTSGSGGSGGGSATGPKCASELGITRCGGKSKPSQNPNPGMCWHCSGSGKWIQVKR